MKMGSFYDLYPHIIELLDKNPNGLIYKSIVKEIPELEGPRGSSFMGTLSSGKKVYSVKVAVSTYRQWTGDHESKFKRGDMSIFFSPKHKDKADELATIEKRRKGIFAPNEKEREERRFRKSHRDITILEERSALNFHETYLREVVGPEVESFIVHMDTLAKSTKETIDKYVDTFTENMKKTVRDEYQGLIEKITKRKLALEKEN